MGIFIHLSISHSITQKEWTPVYEEALSLARKLGLAEARREEIGGVPVCYFALTREYTEHNEWRNTDWTGFCVSADYATLQSCEQNYIPRDLGADTNPSERFDAMLETYRACNDHKYRSNIYGLLGAKTQGYAHHLPLLAVCCLIQDRLGAQAFVYGDISAGQCRRAVEMANDYLDPPISVPDFCSSALLPHIHALPIPEAEQIALLGWAYTGKKDAAYGAALRASFGEEACARMWDARCEEYNAELDGVRRLLTDYLNQGFDLEALCRRFPFKVEDPEAARTLFVRKLLNTGLCEESRKSVVSPLDPDREAPYGIGALFANWFSGGPCLDPSIYMPLEACRELLIRGLGSREAVETGIAAYQEEKQKKAEEQNSEPKETLEAAPEEQDAEATEEEYDIETTYGLIHYQPGCSIDPDLLVHLRRFFAFYTKIAQEERMTALKESGATECFRFLAKNPQLKLRDCDWQQIYDRLCADPESFARYYPAGQAEIESDAAMYVLRAILTNDDFYALLCGEQSGN